MTLRRESACGTGLAVKFSAVSLLGFAVDAGVLHLGLYLGVAPAWARVISLICAMQTTFVVNGLFVFRCLDRTRFVRQWTSYMVTNGFGNFCNYWIFLTLVSTHWRVIGSPLFALSVGSVVAWTINFTGARLVAFGKPGGLATDPAESQAGRR